MKKKTKLKKYPLKPLPKRIKKNTSTTTIIRTTATAAVNEINKEKEKEKEKEKKKKTNITATAPKKNSTSITTNKKENTITTSTKTTTTTTALSNVKNIKNFERQIKNKNNKILELSKNIKILRAEIEEKNTVCDFYENSIHIKSEKVKKEHQKEIECLKKDFGKQTILYVSKIRTLKENVNPSCSGNGFNARNSHLEKNEKHKKYKKYEKYKRKRASLSVTKQKKVKKSYYGNGFNTQKFNRLKHKEKIKKYKNNNKNKLDKNKNNNNNNLNNLNNCKNSLKSKEISSKLVTISSVNKVVKSDLELENIDLISRIKKLSNIIREHKQQKQKEKFEINNLRKELNEIKISHLSQMDDVSKEIEKINEVELCSNEQFFQSLLKCIDERKVKILKTVKLYAKVKIMQQEKQAIIKHKIEDLIANSGKCIEKNNKEEFNLLTNNNSKLKNKKKSSHHLSKFSSFDSEILSVNNNCNNIKKAKKTLSLDLCNLSIKDDEKKAKKVENLLREFLVTEENYVKNLDLLICYFIVPFYEKTKPQVDKKKKIKRSESDNLNTININPKKSSLCKTKQQEIDLKKYFGQLNLIYQINTKFLNELKSLIKLDKDSNNVDCIISFSSVILKYSHAFKLYCDYISNFAKFQSLVIELKKQKTITFLDFLREQQNKLKDLNCRIYKFDSFLIIPVQRIPRYQLFMDELVRNTSKFKKEYILLEKGAKIISEIAKYNNEKTKEVKNDQLMIKLKNQLELVDFIVPHRRLLLEGKCFRKKKNRKELIDSKIILFTDVLLVYPIKYNKSKFKIKQKNKKYYYLIPLTNKGETSVVHIDEEMFLKYKSFQRKKDKKLQLVFENVIECVKFLEGITGRLDFKRINNYENDKQKIISNNIELKKDNTKYNRKYNRKTGGIFGIRSRFQHDEYDFQNLKKKKI